MTNPGNPVDPASNDPSAPPAPGAPERRATRQRPFSLTRWFSLLSLVCIGAA